MIQILQVTVYQLISVAAIYHAEQFTDDYGRRDLADEWRAYRPTGELSQAALIDAGSFQRLISRQIGSDFLTNFFYAPDVVRPSRVGKNVRAKSEVIPDSVSKPNPPQIRHLQAHCARGSVGVVLYRRRYAKLYHMLNII